MAGTLTLVEFAKIEKNPLVKSVAMTLVQESQPMKYIPWETTNLLYKKMVRVQSLPSVSRRKLNSGWTSSTGKTEQLMEGMSIVGGNIDVDKEMVEGNQTIEDVRAIQLEMKTRAAAYDFNDNFINGSIVVDENNFDGLKVRCNRTEMSAQKLVSATSTNLITDTTAHALDFIAEMDKLMYSIDGHTPTFLITNSTGLLKINQALRMASVLNQAKDQFGQIVTMWGPCPIYDAGVKADQSTRIMGDEAIDGTDWASVNKYFSIYAVKIGEGTDFWGIQKHALETIDKGLLEDAVTYRTNINWPVGLSQINKRALSRLYGVRSA
jgi:hypothetical protein